MRDASGRPAESSGAGGERVAYVAELQCFLCGVVAGTIESDRKPLPPNGVFRPVGAQPRLVPDWRQLRCQRCGGALYAEGIETVVRRDPEDELRREEPRRGRPPRWLVEQRRRLREEAETRS